MTPLRQRMTNDMTVRGLAENTKRSYLTSVTGLARHYRRSPDQISAQEVQDYLIYLHQQRGLSWKSCNCVRHGVRFLYRITLGVPDPHFYVPGAKTPSTLPQILNHDELVRLFTVTTNPKHRALLMTAYAAAGRGLQQMLLIFAYLYSHRRSVLLIDEPDAHLEILRQKQVYVLLREIASENESQVILVTHSEVILEEALDRNLTLLLDGRADDLAAKTDIRNALKHYGTGHYVRARQRGYVLYVEGRTDLDILRALARRLDHPAADSWDDRINAFYVQDNFPGPNPQLDSEIERVEGGFGVTPREHFFALREMLPELNGLAILDRDRSHRTDTDGGGLQIRYWRRYEVENYFITPAVLKQYAKHAYSDLPLFAEPFTSEFDEVLDALILERVFSGRASDFATWQGLDVEAARLLWEASTERIKLSDFAETFFRRVAERLGHAMLLRKGDLHQLVNFIDPSSISTEVSETLDLLKVLFDAAKPGEGA